MRPPSRETRPNFPPLAPCLAHSCIRLSYQLRAWNRKVGTETERDIALDNDDLDGDKHLDDKRSHPHLPDHEPGFIQHRFTQVASNRVSARWSWPPASSFDPPLEMPSFLNNEDNSAIFSNNPDILNLDPTNQFGLATTKERVNGGSIRHTRSDTINESFDESSISSTHASDVSEPTPTPMNGNGTRPTSMSSISNGQSVTAIYPPRQDDETDVYRQKPMPNGTATLPDRTYRHSADTNGTGPVMTSSNGHQYPTTLSKPLPSEPPTEETYEKPPSRSLDAPTTAPPPPPEPRGSQSQTALPTTAHRLSSPPVYVSGNTAGSSPGLLQAPGPGGLKQRNTLDVPKHTPGRGSRDGMDTAQASGRFSPTGAPATGGRRPSLSLGRRPTRSMQSDAPRDEIIPDEDALRWTEAVRAKRASKRRKKEEEDDERVIVGTKVDETHANWVTAYNMLTGIRVSVSRTNAKLDRELTDADFETKQKSTFDM